MLASMTAFHRLAARRIDPRGTLNHGSGVTMLEQSPLVAERLSTAPEWPPGRGLARADYG